MDKKEIQVFNEATEKWGKEAQIDIAMEECAELILAISKLKRTNFTDADKISHVLEEMADVRIMLDQLILLLGDNSKEVENLYRKNKIERLKQRIRI